MPLRLNVGVTRKLGLPTYSSIGASCSLDLEVDSGLLRDLPGFHAQVRDAFVAAQQAVNDELARLQAQATGGDVPEAEAVNGHGAGVHASNGALAGIGAQAGHGSRLPGPQARQARTGKPATPGQIKAIVAIARRQRADLDGLLCDYGVTRPEELSLANASQLIDQLKAAGNA